MPAPVFLPPGAPLWFPDASDADEDGLLALGADLEPERLLHAYDHGIFPWYEEGLPPLWWSPGTRAVFVPRDLRVSRRLARRLRQERFELTWDRAFPRVMAACGESRDAGTWIIPEMLAAYERLHVLGHAHSLEVWRGDALIGGIYGVHRGGLFAAESMFHRETAASKIALVALVRTLAARGIELIDAQLATEHLVRLGAVEWPRARYVAEVARLRDKVVDLAGLTPRWSD